MSQAPAGGKSPHRRKFRSPEPADSCTVARLQEGMRGGWPHLDRHPFTRGFPIRARCDSWYGEVNHEHEVRPDERCPMRAQSTRVIYFVLSITLLKQSSYLKDAGCSHRKCLSIPSVAFSISSESDLQRERAWADLSSYTRVLSPRRVAHLHDILSVSDLISRHILSPSTLTCPLCSGPATIAGA